ncbi:MAG: IS3 family transposase [Gemmatimonadetes bacterium]|nr:IS3 family transposase [Gemmatimonadota bacterium]
MKRKCFTEEQIVAILKEAAASDNARLVVRKHGITETTFCRWKAKYSGIGVPEVKRLKALEEENARLKRRVADLSLDNAMLRDVVGRKLVTPAQRRTAVTHLRATYPVSTRRACELVHLARSRWYHQSVRAADTDLAEALREKAAQRPRWGYRRLHVLLARDGWQVNHKRVRRVYRAAGLQVRRRKRKQVAVARVPRPAATQPNQVWAMDFISDQCANGRRFRVLSLIDTCTRECLALEVDTSLPAARVVRVLDDVTSLRGVPRAITVDNGPEFMARALDAWAYARQVQLAFIRPGKPVENAYVESFHDKFRAECLDLHWFADLRDARSVIGAWQDDYNTVRPHGSLKQLTPNEYARTFTHSPHAPAYTS